MTKTAFPGGDRAVYPRLRGLIPHPRLFVPIVLLAGAVLAACSDKKEPTGVDVCVEPPTAHFIPEEVEIVLGSDSFNAVFNVVDCRNNTLEDVYTWGTTDAMIIEVSPGGEITPVGLGTAYATVTGRDNGLVGRYKITVQPAP
jgi:hypothetical protein